jgi:hypothetical protein
MDMLLDYTPLGLVMKARNAMLDAVFYDVSSLTFDEWVSLNPAADRKGKVIVVSPTGSRKSPSIRHYGSVEEFAHSKDWNCVFAVVVTGVGGSVVGTAALARNVADACKDLGGGDVAGVVSGYGVADVMQEALGGWYFYGKLNQYRYDFENAMNDLGAVISEYFAKGIDVRKQLSRYFGTPLGDYVPLGPDVHALHEILSRRYQHQNTSIRLLVGHSKGNLLISDVLDHLRDELSYVDDDDKAFHNLAVVTLGAVVDISTDIIPEENQYQFLGTWDALGYLNSRAKQGDLAPRTRLPGKWHSLNRHFLGHMDVFDILQNKVTIPPPPEHRPDGGDHLASERTNRVTAALEAAALRATANGN